MGDGDPKHEKGRFWKIDPEPFKPGRHKRLRETLKNLAISVGKILGIVLLIAYPVLLTILGVEYGGLVFWGILAGSLAVTGLLLQRLGYAKRFGSRDTRFLRKLVALFLAFVVIVCFLLASLWFTRGPLP